MLEKPSVCKNESDNTLKILKRIEKLLVEFLKFAKRFEKI